MSKIFIETHGCSLNQSDSELMAGLVKQKGHELVGTAGEADVVIVNSCSVKQLAENKLFKKLRELNGKKVIVTGCVPQAEVGYKDTKLKDYSLVGVTQLNKINDAIEETLSGNRVVLLQRDSSSERLNLPKIRKNPIVEIVPISAGCLDSCTYCKTKHARGNLRSYPPIAIITQVKQAVSDGAKEIWLTSQDDGAYGQDIGTNIAKLLKAVNEIPGDFRVRLGMSNPRFFLQFLDEIVEAYKGDKIYKFLHIPIQSGNNQVLKDMKRPYKVREVKKIISIFRKEIPEITISTDIICGFPTETKSAFEDTLKLVKEIKFDVINVSRFWPRPNTPAARMKQLNGRITKERSTALIKLKDAIVLDKNMQWVGRRCKILVDERGVVDGTWIGRNDFYKQVVIRSDENLFGKQVDVKISGATAYDLRGEIITNFD